MGCGPRYHAAMDPKPLTQIAIYGAAGRMGQAIIAAASAMPEMMVAAAMVRAQSNWLEQPVAGSSDGRGEPLLYASALDPDLAVQVLIDFSAGAAFDNALAIAVQRRLAFVSGTTGLDPGQLHALQQAAKHIPLLWSANFSLGVALLQRLVTTAARSLGPEFVAEIVDAHHQQKTDAPSGTALVLGRAIAAARGDTFDLVAKRGRDGQIGARPPAEIGFSSIRGGDIVGEHTVLFIAPGERIELCHRAYSRDLFARGALRAAQWLCGQPAGRYRMEDLIAD